MVLPAVTGIAQYLTPLAAIGPAIGKLFAVGVQVSQYHGSKIGPSLVLLVVSLLVAWGRATQA